MPRIDSHVHVFPDRLAERVRETLNQRGGLSGSPLVADVAARVHEAGFDAAWALPYAHKPGIAANVNEWSAEVAARYPGLVAGATFHPGDDDLEALVHRALVELGLRVVKLHCSVGQFAVDDDRLAPLWDCASETGAPVVVHAGRRSPGATEDDELEGVAAVLDRWSGVPFVLAHTGFPATSAAIRLMDRYPNLYGDLTPVWDQPQTVPVQALERLAGRFLFGSDAPNNPIQAEKQAAGYEQMGLSNKAFAELMGDAALRLVPTR